MKQKLLKTMLLLSALVVGNSNVWGDTTVSISSFSATSGDIDTNISYAAYKGTGTTAPAVSSSTLRIYKPSSGESTGGYITVTAASGYEISSITITNSDDKAGTIKYSVDSGSLSSAVSLAKSASHTVNSLEATSIDFYNCGSDRLSIAGFSVTYSSTSSGAATTTTIDASGITNTNKFVSTTAGTLTAAVKVTSTSATVDGATVTWSGDDDKVATINSSTGAVTLVGAGKVNFTATYAGVAGTYLSSSAKYTMTVTNEDPALVTLWSEDFGGYSSGNVPSSGLNAKYTCVDGTSATKIYSEKLAGGSEPELLVGQGGGSFTVNLKDMQFCTGDLTLTFKVNNTNISVDASSTSGDVTVSGTVASGSNTYTIELPANPADLTIVFSNSNTKNVRLDDIVLKGYPGDVYYRKVTAGNFGTICLPRTANDLSSAGATFFEVAGTTLSGVVLTEVNALAAGTPYVFKATGSKLSVPVSGDATTVQDATGLVGNLSTTPLEVADGNYILSGNKLRMVDGGTATVGQYRAYFDLSGVSPYSGAKGFILDMDMDDVDGINSLTPALSEGEEAIYNVAGQRLQKMQKGINIVNGKKVLF